MSSELQARQVREPLTTQGLIVLASFALVVAFLGGSSYPNTFQIAILRPLAPLFLIPALLNLDLDRLNEARLPVFLLGALGAWMALQLIPLPPGLWQALPGRVVLAELDAMMGQFDLWRPISLAPARTFNALASLVVPIAAALLVLAYRMRSAQLLILLSALGVLDALLGLGQIVSGAKSPLYFYEFTHRGSPVGVLANENHSAVFSAIALLVITRLGTIGAQGGAMRTVRFAAAPAYGLVLLAVLVSGSRMGLSLAALAVITSGLMLLLSNLTEETGAAAPRPERAGILAPNPRIILSVFAAAIALTVIAFLLLERTPAFEKILSSNVFEDLRALIWPTLQQMMATFWLTGAGFGAFEDVYRIYEPTTLLQSRYVNQAHNDWAQLVIEGGLPAVALLAVLLAWIGWSIRSLIFGREAALCVGLSWMGIFAILAAASIVDYPLRTPVFQAAAMWLLVLLAQDRRAAG